MSEQDKAKGGRRRGRGGGAAARRALRTTSTIEHVRQIESPQHVVVQTGVRSPAGCLVVSDHSQEIERIALQDIVNDALLDEFLIQLTFLLDAGLSGPG